MNKNSQNKFINILKKTWHFIWEDDSLLSWIVNIILAIVLIKFVIYPGLGLALGTQFPIVAVVSNSMEHNSQFDSWWGSQHAFYDSKNISMEDFTGFPFRNGFNKGDLMILTGSNPAKTKIGEVIVFMAGQPDPIIHRVVEIKNSSTGIVYETKGDNNPEQIITYWLDETNVREDTVVGKAVFRIPYLGWVKIIAVNLVSSIIHISR